MLENHWVEVDGDRGGNYAYLKTLIPKGSGVAEIVADRIS